MLMEKSGRKKCFSCSPFRWRQQVAKERRFCILWINRMVKKQVQKRTAELQSEFLLMNQNLREEMLARLHEQLRQLVEVETEERAVYHILLDREKRTTSRWLREMDEGYKDNTTDDEEDEEDSASDDADTSDLFNEDSSRLAKCEQEEPPSISTDCTETSQLMKESEEHEEESSKSHANLCLGMEELRCLEEGRVQGDRTKEEEALLTEKEWKEWMDKQEMRVYQKLAKAGDQQSSEKQWGAGLPVSENQMRENTKGVKTMKKIKTYLSDIFNPSYKWERFEDED